MGVRWPVGYANCSYHFSMAGIDGEAISSVGLKDDGAGFSVAMATAIFDSFISDGCWANQANSVIFEKVVLATGPSHPGGLVYVSTSATFPGGESGDQLIPNTTSLVRKYTGLGGRAGRGRMYLPLVRDADVEDDGAIDGGTLTAVQTALEAHFATVQGLGFLHYLFHDSNVVPTAISTFTLEPKVATQRGRLSR